MKEYLAALSVSSEEYRGIVSGIQSVEESQSLYEKLTAISSVLSQQVGKQIAAEFDAEGA